MSDDENGILLIEDRPADIALARQALTDRGINDPVILARDGAEALELLQPDADGPDAVQPRMILMDLDMPRMSGFDFLIHLRADPRTREMPVVVFTSPGRGTRGQDLLRHQEYADDASVPKPATARELLAAVQALGVSWLDITRQLPMMWTPALAI